jgi:hypothetical protein
MVIEVANRYSTELSVLAFVCKESPAHGMAGLSKVGDSGFSHQGFA